MIVLLVLCLAAPQLPWGSIELRSSQHGCSDLASPSNSSTQIVRATGKADKTFSSGCLATTDTPSRHLPSGDAQTGTAHSSNPPNLALDCPPLAPRPPPFA